MVAFVLTSSRPTRILMTPVRVDSPHLTAAFGPVKWSTHSMVMPCASINASMVAGLGGTIPNERIPARTASHSLVIGDLPRLGDPLRGGDPQQDQVAGQGTDQAHHAPGRHLERVQLGVDVVGLNHQAVGLAVVHLRGDLHLSLPASSASSRSWLCSARTWLRWSAGTAASSSAQERASATIFTASPRAA